MQRRYRLKSYKAFTHIYKRGESVSDRLLVLMWVKSKEEGLKVGVTVSKKVGNSVKRNKVRRRLKEAFRTLIPRVKIGYNYVILARSPVVDATYQDIIQSLTGLLIRSRNYRPEEDKE